MQARAVEHESNSKSKRSAISDQPRKDSPKAEKQRRRILAEESEATEMPATDTNDDSIRFSVEEIVQYPLPGYMAPSSISFSHDDRLVSYLFSSDGTLYRKIFAFDIVNRRQELIFSPPEGGGLDETNLSAEEKLRRERSRERGLGVTRYEWRATSPYTVGKPSIMVPLPSGVRL